MSFTRAPRFICFLCVVGLDSAAANPALAPTTAATVVTPATTLCDICYEEIVAIGPAATYCNCKTRFRHLKCLQTWRLWSDAANRCEICQAEYRNLKAEESQSSVFRTILYMLLGAVALTASYMALGLLMVSIPGVMGLGGDSTHNNNKNFWAVVFITGILVTHVLLSIFIICRYGLELSEDISAYMMLICGLLWLVLFVPISFVIYFHKMYLWARGTEDDADTPTRGQSFSVEYLLA